jgi:hypothetical protein
MDAGPAIASAVLLIAGTLLAFTIGWMSSRDEHRRDKEAGS